MIDESIKNIMKETKDLTKKKNNENEDLPLELK